MNATQITAIRNFHESTKAAPARYMTAREMALTSHNMSRTGNFATLSTGEKYAWSDTQTLWMYWK
jgi:hypothetical protein